MKIIIVSGSHRANSESERAARFIEKELKSLSPAAGIDLLSLAKNPLPLWDESAWSDEPPPEGPHLKALWTPISQQLRAADGYVIVTPEWSGMTPAALKNLFLFCNKNELAHKPALLVAVSSGMGGSYPIAELRMSSYKNTRICYIPDHVIIRQCTEMLKGDIAAGQHDAGIRKRIRYSLQILMEYIKAFRAIRESNLVDYKAYPYGM